MERLSFELDNKIKLTQEDKEQVWVLNEIEQIVAVKFFTM